MEEKAQEVVKLSQEDIQKFQVRLDTLEKENVTLKGAVTMMKQEKDELAKDVQTYRQQAKVGAVEKLCAQMEHDLNVTPACLEIIRPVLLAENGVVKLAEGEKPEKQAAVDAMLEIVRLAKNNTLFVPETGKLPTGKQKEEVLTKEQQREKAIQKFMADKKVSYGEAYSQAAKDPQFSELFNPLKAFERKEEI